MLGVWGALACLGVCAAAGLSARNGCRRRWQWLEQWLEALEAARLLLEEERLPLDELLAQAALAVSPQEASVAHLLGDMAQSLRQSPRLTLWEACAQARTRISLPGEQAEEQAALEAFFHQMGHGTAAMRSRAAAACLRRLEVIREKARCQAERSGPLYARLGVLGGLMLGIALW